MPETKNCGCVSPSKEKGAVAIAQQPLNFTLSNNRAKRRAAGILCGTPFTKLLGLVLLFLLGFFLLGGAVLLLVEEELPGLLVGHAHQAAGQLVPVGQGGIFHLGLGGLVPGEGDLQSDGSEDAAHHHHDDDGPEVGVGHQAHGGALVGHDQGHLAPARHAQADLGALVPVVAAGFGPQAAAHQLGEDGHDHQQQGKHQDLPGHRGQRDFQADAGEEHRGQQQVGKGLELGIDISAPGGVGDDDAGGESADDVRHAEDPLGDIGHEQAQHKGQQGEPVQVLLIPVLVPGKALDAQESHNGHEHEEQQNLQQDHPHVYRVPGHAGDDGEDDQAQHVVDEGRRQDGVAHPGIQLAQLLEGLYSDGHGGGGEDGADEDMLQHHGGIALTRGEQEAQGRAHSERHQHADEGHQKAGLPGVFQLPHVGGHAGAEHHDDDADLRDGVQEIAGLHNAQHPGPEDQAGQQRAHNLGQLQLLGDQAEHLGAQQDQRDVQQKIIRFQKYYPFLS